MPYSSADLLAALPRLRRYARFLTDEPADADPLVEETLRRARESGDGSAHVAPTVGLLRVLRAVHAERTKARDADPPISLFSRGQRAAEPPSATAPLPRVRPTDSLIAGLFKLPLEQREVLALVAVERLSYEETASLLSVPVATVFARLVQARATLHSIASDTHSVPERSR
jgi:RNA polymerase sigma-70 factor (ECF subfamily)